MASQPAFDFGDDELDDPTNPTFTVGELADAINDQLRRGFREGVWVRGEIDGLVTRGAHTYFSLVERGDDGKAVLQVQLFAPAKRRLLPVLKKANLELRDGMKVRIHGYLDFWAQGGRLGLKMSGIDPRYTLGEIAQSRDEIVRRLVADGLIDANASHPISPVPLRVGVATSVESAAWADFRTEIEHSGVGFTLRLADCRVQGDGAEAMIAAAIGTLARRAARGELDVIAVIRGGGARNELAVFDAEIIARTIAAAPVPVFTGLGHEIDRSVADDVAHTVLKTPTACAAALVDRASTYLSDAELAWEAIGRRATGAIGSAEQRLHELRHGIAARTRSAVERADERLAMRRTVLRSVAPAALDRGDERLHTMSSRLLERARLAADRETARLDVFAARAAALDPAVQLARGWSITRSADGRVVRSTADVEPGREVVTTVIDGRFTAVIGTVQPDPVAAPGDDAPETDAADD